MSATQEVGEIFGDGIGMAHAMLRSPTVLIASIGLWGMNVYVFRRFNIDYVKILQYDVRKLYQEEEKKLNQQRKLLQQQHHSETELMLLGNNNTSNTITTNTSNIDSNGDRMELEDQTEVSIMDTSFNNNDDYNLDGEITSGQLICFSLTLLLLLHGTYSIWIGWFQGGTLGAIMAFYFAVATAIWTPLKSTRWLRHSADVVLHRLWELIHPRWCHYYNCTDVSEKILLPRPIPFVDVFFADGMCSLSKVFFDIGMLMHMASYYPKPVAKSAWNILIPSACAAVPYMIRARQCLVMWTVTSLKNDPGRYQHLWNALKYSTSIFPLLLSAYQKTVMAERAEDLESALIVLLVINASYALWWDVVMDWGMMKTPAVAASMLCHPIGYAPLPTITAQPPTKPLARSTSSGSNGHSTSCWYALLRSRLRYGVSVSIVILIADIILRFSWTLRFWHQLFPSNDSFVLWSQFLEVIRRALWNLLRIEWEHMKQSGAVSTSPTVGPNGSPPDDSSTAASSSFSLRNAMVVPSATKPKIARNAVAAGAATNKPKITTEKNAEA